MEVSFRWFSFSIGWFFLVNQRLTFKTEISDIWGIYSRHFLLQARSISSEPGQLKARRCAETMDFLMVSKPPRSYWDSTWWETCCQNPDLHFFPFGASWIHDIFWRAFLSSFFMSTLRIEELNLPSLGLKNGWKMREFVGGFKFQGGFPKAWRFFDIYTVPRPAPVEEIYPFQECATGWGGDGFMGSYRVCISRIRWSVAASDSGAHVFDPALAATAFEVGGLDGSYRCNSIGIQSLRNHQAVLSWLEPSIARSEALLSLFLVGKCCRGTECGEISGGNEDMKKRVHIDWIWLISIDLCWGHFASRLEVAWERNGSATQGLGMGRKMRGKPCGNPHLEHWMQHESTHVTESWRVWSQGRLVSKRSSTSMWDRGRSCVFRIEYFLSIRHRNS